MASNQIRSGVHGVFLATLIEVVSDFSLPLPDDNHQRTVDLSNDRWFRGMEVKKEENKR